jgi:GNAT superfamily N-acetyltransferase
MRVRAATQADRAAVANVLDGAALETDPDLLARSLERGETFVAVAGEDGERVLGALVLDGDRIVSVAVRRRRRGQGIGTALVERALAERGRLVATFDEGVRPFYEKLAFEIEPVEDESSRYCGRRER